jgi:predicted DNA-binding transcriptional regulator AlpA
MTRTTGNAFYAREMREMRMRSLPRRGLRLVEAANYIGVSVSLFERLVEAGDMPNPKMIEGVPVWDIDAVDLFFTALPEARQKAADRPPPQ